MSIEKAFEFGIAIRKNFMNVINDLSLEQLNHIPKNFNNNIAWNFGHIVVSGYALAYIATGIRPELSILYKEDFGKGSKPQQWIDETLIHHFKNLAFSSLEDIKNDIISGEIKEVQPYITHTFGIANNTPEAVMQCIAMHDSYHYGCVRMLLNQIKYNH